MKIGVIKKKYTVKDNLQEMNMKEGQDIHFYKKKIKKLNLTEF